MGKVPAVPRKFTGRLNESSEQRNVRVSGFSLSWARTLTQFELPPGTAIAALVGRSPTGMHRARQKQSKTLWRALHPHKGEQNVLLG